MKVQIKQLKAFQVLSSSKRISSIDIFRSLAILSVVVFHFNGILPYGYLGVDLFFVISGFLIGGILTKEYVAGRSINILKFILQRGFKVWPSYYSFLFVGTIIAHLFYQYTDTNQIIPLWDTKRYLFFYQNYTGKPFHWSFDHIWSLCVEEHFYILLPIIFIVCQRILKKRNFLFSAIGLLVIVGFLSKILMLYYTHSKDTYSATNNRIDALAWGVIMNFVIFFFEKKLRDIKGLYLFFIGGLILLIILLITEINIDSVFYHKVIFHSITPICFALMIAGVYFLDFSKLKTLRVIAYYSYNWYLWHPIFVFFIISHIGFNVVGFVLYILVSFIFAVVFTVFVEENVLAKRNLVLSKFK